MNWDVGKGGGRFNPGDLAVISRCANEAHIGLIVRVMGAHATPHYDWDVELLGSPVEGYAAGHDRVGIFRCAAVFDWNLSRLVESARSNRVVRRERARA